VIYAVHAAIMRLPIIAVTRRHILESGRMLDENAARGVLGLPCKPIGAIGVSVTNPANLNCNSAIERHRLDGVTLTEGELRSHDVWIASVQRSRSRHAMTEATLPSPTPDVPGNPRGRTETGASNWPAPPSFTRNDRTVREPRSCPSRAASRTMTDRFPVLPVTLRGRGKPGMQLHRTDL
jgi:hypothetical protein